MIRVEVINEDFTLQKFDELKNIKRKGTDTYGKLYIGDSFDCTEDMAKYLSGANPLKKAFIKVIEILPKIEIKKVIESAKDDKEYITPLNTKEELEKLGEEIVKHIEVKTKPKKKKNKK